MPSVLLNLTELPALPKTKGPFSFSVFFTFRFSNYSRILMPTKTQLIIQVAKISSINSPQNLLFAVVSSVAGQRKFISLGSGTRKKLEHLRKDDVFIVRIISRS